MGKETLGDGIKHSHLLLTRNHWDHINGFPFFAPAFVKNETFHIYAGHLMDKGGIRKVFASQMANPVFPVPLEAMQATLVFEDFQAGENLDLAKDVQVRTAPAQSAQ